MFRIGGKAGGGNPELLAGGHTGPPLRQGPDPWAAISHPAALFPCSARLSASRCHAAAVRDAVISPCDCGQTRCGLRPPWALPICFGPYAAAHDALALFIVTLRRLRNAVLSRSNSGYKHPGLWPSFGLSPAFRVLPACSRLLRASDSAISTKNFCSAIEEGEKTRYNKKQLV